MQVTRNQHLISKSLLTRFASPPSGNLLAYDLEHANATFRNPSQVAYVRDFVTAEPNRAEALWQTVETGLPAAIDEVEAGVALRSSETVTLLKQVIALHFFRRDRTRLSFQSSMDAKLKERSSSYGVDPSLASFDPELVAREVEKRVRAAGPEWFQNHLESLFARGQALVGPAGLEVVTARSGEFLIGDSAVLSMKRGIEDGMLPFSDAGTHLLPLGRHHAIAIGPKNIEVDIDEGTVERLNAGQIRLAVSHVYMHTESRLEPFVVATTETGRHPEG